MRVSAPAKEYLDDHTQLQRSAWTTIDDNMTTLLCKAINARRAETMHVLNHGRHTLQRDLGVVV